MVNFDIDFHKTISNEDLKHALNNVRPIMTDHPVLDSLANIDDVRISADLLNELGMIVIFGNTILKGWRFHLFQSVKAVREMLPSFASLGHAVNFKGNTK